MAANLFFFAGLPEVARPYYARTSPSIWCVGTSAATAGSS